jgi:hypothetical protein
MIFQQECVANAPADAGPAIRIGKVQPHFMLRF